ncbi:MAG TPA: LuxR C-terminal-related transcriptional regulator [Cellulomonas sp.]
MSIDPARRGPGLAPGVPSGTRTGAAGATALSPRRPVAADPRDPRRRGLGQMCVVVTELAEGDAQTLVRNLRRRGSGRVILLARRASRRELVTLLTGGLRGAVATEPNAATGQSVAAAPEAAPAPFARSRPELTSRELSVLRLVADGCSNRAIGEELGLSALTVKSHLARISRKLGTGDRAALVAISIRTGLLS